MTTGTAPETFARSLLRTKPVDRIVAEGGYGAGGEPKVGNPPGEGGWSTSPPRSFRTPLYPLTPLLGVALCVCLMVGLGGVTWTVFAIWIAVGLAAYFLYGRRHSRLAARTAHGGEPA